MKNRLMEFLKFNTLTWSKKNVFKYLNAECTRHLLGRCNCDYNF